MLKIVKCHNCGKPKQWTINTNEPKWIETKVLRTDIISPQNHNIKINVQFCSEECLKQYRRINERF